MPTCILLKLYILFGSNKKLRVSDKVGSLIDMLLKNEDSNSHCVCYSILVEKPWVEKSDELLARYMSMLLA